MLAGFPLISAWQKNSATTEANKIYDQVNGNAPKQENASNGPVPNVHEKAIIDALESRFGPNLENRHKKAWAEKEVRAGGPRAPAARIWLKYAPK
jgi:hypothetical protein